MYFLWRKTFAQHREGKAFLMGWAFLRPAESSSSWIPIAHCPSQHRVPLGKSSPWPFVSSSLCFLLCEFLHLKEAQIPTEISLQSGSLCHAPCLGEAICGVCGFKPTIGQVSSANLSTELSSQFQQAHDFYLTCCQYFELSVALEGSFLSSRLFPRINRAR